jgi:hypothetical protein
MGGGMINLASNTITYVQMGPCKRCGTDWALSQAEWNHYQELTVKRGFIMPTHCLACRVLKRQKEKAGLHSYNAILSKLSQMMVDNEKGRFAFDPDALDNDLREVARQFKAFSRQLDVNLNLQKEENGQST